MNKWQEFIERIGQNRVRTDKNAELYIETERIDDLVNVVEEARVYSIPIFIIGAGSWPNIPKGKVEGLLIKNNCRRFDIYGMSGKMNEGQMGINFKLVYAESGTLLNQLVRFTIEEGLSGLEYNLGLPGTIGGAIYTNARYAPKNIYINDVIEKLKILKKSGEILEVQGDYFISRSNSEFLEAHDIILSAIFRLVPEDKSLLWQRAHEAAEHRNKLNE